MGFKDALPSWLGVITFIILYVIMVMFVFKTQEEKEKAGLANVYFTIPFFTGLFGGLIVNAITHGVINAITEIKSQKRH